MRTNQIISFQEFSNRDNLNTVTIRTTLPWKSEKIHILKDSVLIYDSAIENNPSTEELRNLLGEHDGD